METETTLVSSDIQLTGVYGRERLKIPLRTKFCKHLPCFDEAQLLKESVIANKGEKCPFKSCEEEFKDFATDIVIDEKMEEILDSVREDCLGVTYFFKHQFYFCKDPSSHSLSKEKDHTNYFHMLIDEIHNRKDHNISYVISATKIHGIFNLSLICPISLRRINLPCRFKSCLHLETFDLIPYLLRCHWLSYLPPPTKGYCL